MGRTIRPPKPPRLPDSLPFEKQVDRILNQIGQSLEQSKFGQSMKRLDDKLPVFESVDFPTPVVNIKTPNLKVPSLTPPKMNDRRREAIKAAVGQDLGEFIEIIPIVGFIVEPIGNSIQDNFSVKIQETLTEAEWKRFRQLDKASPLSTIAMVATFAQDRLEK